MALSPGTRRLLLVEPDEEVRRVVESTLDRAGYGVTSLGQLPAALDLLGRTHHDAVIVALPDPGESILDHVREVKRRGDSVAVVILCDPPRVRLAIEALRGGADDYLLRPPDPIELKTRLERILDRRELASRISFFQEEISKKSVLQFEVHSPAMRSVRDRVMRVAPMRTTVMIHGESGAGKELVARAIHFNSPRRDQPFIALNCAAIPASLIESELFGHEKGAFTGAHTRVRGKFEIADRGTLFLDEIGEMTRAAQVKLLRVLEEREFMRIGGDQSIQVDVRVIAATNADLDALVAEGRFRRDLYYRLKVLTIRVPPLRERRQDTPHLVRSFLDQLARVNAVSPKSISPEALTALTDYSWPGNVRELKNLLESLLVSVTGDTIHAEDLPPSIQKGRARDERLASGAGTTLADMERELIRRTLESTGGNRTHSAELLGIGVRTLQRKIRAYGLSIPPTRRRRRGRETGDAPEKT